MSRKTITSIVAVGTACAALGASFAGIATSSAATTAKSSAASTAKSTSSAGAPGDGRGPGGPGGGSRHGGPGGPGGGGIHSESVRADPDGTGFITTVSDSGTVTKVDGTTLTIKQGTAKETFDTIDVVLNGTVSVQRNGATATASAIKVGDHVRIERDGTTTRVHATTSAFEQQQAARRASDDKNRAAAMTWPAA